MSDTPRTDAMEIDLRLTYDDVAFVNSARELERENTALRKDNLKAHQMACEAGLERDRLRDELAALREAFAKADVLAEHSRFDGRREWTVVETWVYPNDIIVQMDRAAFDAARKEAKP